MALTQDAIADLVTTTLRDLGPLKWTDISTNTQEYYAMPKMLKNEKVTFGSGYGIQWNVMVTTSGNANNVGLYAVDNVNVGDVMKTANIPWRHTVASYAFDRREISMNREPARIVDLVKARRADAMISMADRMEIDFWGKPADSTDQTTPFGIKYWNVMGSTSAGFNGGDPSGFTAGAAGLASATYTRWQNYCSGYTSVSKTDLVSVWRAAATKTNFKPPIEVADYNRGSNYGYYTNYSVLASLETLLENQNDNLGNDLASKDGQCMFRKTPVQWVPYLDGTTQNPVYGLNWGVFYPCFLEGEYMREEGPIMAPNQHNVSDVFVDNSYNWCCKNRRLNFVLATATF